MAMPVCGIEKCAADDDRASAVCVSQATQGKLAPSPAAPASIHPTTVAAQGRQEKHGCGLL